MNISEINSILQTYRKQKIIESKDVKNMEFTTIGCGITLQDNTLGDVSKITLLGYCYRKDEDNTYIGERLTEEVLQDLNSNLQLLVENFDEQLVGLLYEYGFELEDS